MMLNGQYILGYDPANGNVYTFVKEGDVYRYLRPEEPNNFYDELKLLAAHFNQVEKWKNGKDKK